MHDADARIASNFGHFRRLVDGAVAHARRGDTAYLAGFAQAAAEFAWRNSVGVFASRQLEEPLREHARAVAARRATDGPSLAKGGAPHVLHVLTRAYESGGHTPLVSRWIREDAGRRHSLALTADRADRHPVPEPLRGSCLASGGGIHHLGHARDLVERAAALRRLARDADVVVLHVHPYDAAPILALGAGGPPTVLLNHADHVFWLGVGVSNVVANLRQAGIDLARQRRGISPARALLLPIPIEPATRVRGRREAKEALGLPPDETLLLSVGHVNKFGPSKVLDFLDIVVPIVERSPNVRLCAVGPDEDERWARAKERTGGRTLAVGHCSRDVLQVYYEAADIYVGSMPFASLTATLEAARMSIPALSLIAAEGTARVLSADEPSLSLPAYCVPDRAAFEARLTEWIEDADARSRAGTELADDVLRVHTGPSWRERLEAVYAAAASQPAELPDPGVDVQRIDDVDRRLLELGRPFAYAEVVKRQRRHLPLWTRLRAALGA